MSFNNNQKVIRPVIFVELLFDDDPLYVNTTPSVLEWDSKVWLGAGELGAISSPVQKIDMSSPILTVSLSGVPVERLNEARLEKYRNRIGNVYLGLFGSDWTLESAPLQIYGGTLDGMSIGVSGKTSTLSVDIGSPFGEWDIPKPYRNTNENQQKIYPGDLGFEYIARMVEVDLVWGVK